MSAIVQYIQVSANSISQYFIRNDYLHGALTLFAILYASTIAPRLPQHVYSWFDNKFVQFLSFFAIVMVTVKNMYVAFILAFSLIVTITISQYWNTLHNSAESFISMNQLSNVLPWSSPSISSPKITGVVPDDLEHVALSSHDSNIDNNDDSYVISHHINDNVTLNNSTHTLLSNDFNKRHNPNNSSYSDDVHGIVDEDSTNCSEIQ
jgi:hypothetical protein